VSLIAVMSVFEEEDLMERAVLSLRRGGVRAIHVFDGAWDGFAGRDEEYDEGWSMDGTMEVAGRLHCASHFPSGMWESQEAKRTYMFHHCDARGGDHVLVFDADEELEGAFSKLLPGKHHNLMVRCVGPNDMPGVRGEWPNGDYAPYYKPEVRVFAYDPELRCVFPGRYRDSRGHIRPYSDAGGTSALPVAEGVSFLHHGNDRTPERRAAKLAYYEREHPKRRERQAAAWREDPW
jgi:hypothetical protein